MPLRQVYRITVFVPPGHVDALIAGIIQADGLVLGEYSEVMWITPGGQEQFRPGLAATPALGAAGDLTRADTVRVEFAVPRDAARLEHVLREGVYPHHPWEVPGVFVDESMFPLPDAVE